MVLNRNGNGLGKNFKQGGIREAVAYEEKEIRVLETFESFGLTALAPGTFSDSHNLLYCCNHRRDTSALPSDFDGKLDKLEAKSQNLESVAIQEC